MSREIYLEAARRIAEGDEKYTCIAVSAVATGRASDFNCPSVVDYLDLMAPEGDDTSWARRRLSVASDRLQYSIIDSAAFDDRAERRHLRVMLLLMMAEAA